MVTWYDGYATYVYDVIQGRWRPYDPSRGR